MKKITLSLLSLFALTATAAVPAGYYNALEGKSGAALKAAAKSAVSKVDPPSYGNGTWDAFEKTDVHTVKGTPVWWDMYSNNLVSVSSGHNGLNIEHSVANSWWGGSKNNAYNDINHLNPSDATANNRKSNFPLGKVATVSWTNDVTTVGKPVSGSCGGASNVYEPCDEYKGDFARVYMYMFTMYDDIAWRTTESGYGYMYDGSAYPSFKPWAAQMLCEWARMDPVSEKEIDRNNAVYGVQGNRNPFIDNPDLFEYIWGNRVGQAFSLSGNPDPGTEDNTPVELLNISFLDGTDGGFTLGSASDSLNLWSLTAKYGLKATAYISNVNHACDSWAVSPVVDLEGYKTASLTFEWAGNFFTSQDAMKQDVSICAREAGTQEWSDLDIPVWPAGTNWTFVESGEISLDAYAGKQLEIGFRYTSTDTRCGTLEIRNLMLTGVKAPVVKPDPVDPTPVEPDDPVIEPVQSGVWILVDSQEAIDTSSKYIILASGENVYMRANLNGKYMESGSVLTPDDGVIEELPEDAAVITLEECGAGYALKVSDTAGNIAGYISSTTAKTITLADNATAEGTSATLTVSGDVTEISYGAAGTLQYNKTAPRFLTYTSKQQPVSLYRLKPDKGDDNIGDDTPIITVVGNAEADEWADAEVYDLNGRRMAEGRPQPGIYIVRTPSRTCKLIVR